MTSLSDRRQAVALIREAQRNGARLKPACGLLGLGIRTFQRWIQGGSLNEDQRPVTKRPEPKNKLSQAERDAVLAVCNRHCYRSAAPAFIVADQLDQGQYLASESTVYRILREHEQMNHRGRQQAPKSKGPATTHTATDANQLWSWDITWLPGPARGTWFYLYLIMDVFSRKIVGQEVHPAENGDLAAELIEKTFWREQLVRRQQPLVLHSDNGSPMKASTFLEKLYDLGITPSRSRPRVSNDNAYSEALFKTLKFRPGFPVKGFQTLAEAREWVQGFVDWYNTEHRHSALHYVTPEQRHNGQATEILAKRQRLIEEARKAHPERWKRHARQLTLPEQVHLNRDRSQAASC